MEAAGGVVEDPAICKKQDVVSHTLHWSSYTWKAPIELPRSPSRWRSLCTPRSFSLVPRRKMELAVLRVSSAVPTRAEGGLDGGALPGAADALPAGHVGQLHVGGAAANLDRLVGEREGGVEEVNVCCVGIA